MPHPTCMEWAKCVVRMSLEFLPFSLGLSNEEQHSLVWDWGIFWQEGAARSWRDASTKSTGCSCRLILRTHLVAHNFSSRRSIASSSPWGHCIHVGHRHISIQNARRINKVSWDGEHLKQRPTLLSDWAQCLHFPRSELSLNIFAHVFTYH